MVHTAGSSVGRHVRSGVLGLAALLLLAGLLPGSVVRPGSAAAFGPCQASVSPHTAPDGSFTGFAFTITDNIDAIGYVQVLSPSGNLIIVSAHSDWLPSASSDPGQATFTGSPIDPGNPIEVDLDAVISYFPSSNWTVYAADNSGGAGAIQCTGGDLSIHISSSSPPIIGSVSASATATTATIDWSTDKLADSRVDYGKTSGYGSTVNDSAMVTNHEMGLTSLTPSTQYHYQVTSVDQDGNTASSVDGTFRTAAQPVDNTGSPPPITPTVVVTHNPGDKTPPTITFTSTPPKIAAKAPTMTGTATDNSAVAKVEYSTDGGQDWLGVDSAPTLGTKQTTFSFTPVNLDDGTYMIMARAIDGGGNITKTDIVTVVIDRLPPIVGGNVISLGPQVLVPDSNGVINTLAGVDLNISLSAIGGATNVNVSASNLDNPKQTPANFALQRSEDSGLWGGTLSFQIAGRYQLVGNGLDGAGNTTTRSIGIISATRPGLILSSKGPVSKATITVYYLDPDTSGWLAWDGRAYGQQNPQTTNKDGSFSLLLPAGMYYLNVSGAGYLPLSSESFTLNYASPVTSVLKLTSNAGANIFLTPWYGLSVQKPDMLSRSTKAASTTPDGSLVGKTLTGLDLTDIAGSRQGPVNWLGKPTVISVLSTWDPATAEQLSALDKLAKNTDLNVKAIGLQDGPGRLRAYNAISGATLPWLADPDSTATSVLNVGSVPTHYFVDRKGTVKQITSGVLTEQQILDALTNLN